MQSILLSNASDVLVICNILNWKPNLQPSKENIPLPATSQFFFFTSLPVRVVDFCQNYRKLACGSASQAQLMRAFICTIKQS